MLNRWWKEFGVLSQKQQCPDPGCRRTVGQQSTKIVNSLSGDLLLPLLNPLVPMVATKTSQFHTGGEIAIESY